MIRHVVHRGTIAENRSAIWGLFLIETEDEDFQSRAVLTEEQVEQHIDRLKKLLEDHRAKLTEERILDALAGGAKLRWVPAAISGKPAEFADMRRCFLGSRELSEDEQFLVSVMVQNGQLREAQGPDSILDVLLPV